MSEEDIYRCHILTYKDGPRAEKTNSFQSYFTWTFAGNHMYGPSMTRVKNVIHNHHGCIHNTCDYLSSIGAYYIWFHYAFLCILLVNQITEIKNEMSV